MVRAKGLDPDHPLQISLAEPAIDDALVIFIMIPRVNCDALQSSLASFYKELFACEPEGRA